MGTKLEGETMNRQETIDSLQSILIYSEFHSLKDREPIALEKAIKVLSEIDDKYFDYLTFEIPNQ